MKFFFKLAFIICFLSFPFNVIVADEKNSSTISEARYKKVCRYGIFNPPECKKTILDLSTKKNKNTDVNEQNNPKEVKETVNTSNHPDCRWGIFNPPKCKGKDSRYKNNEISLKEKKK